MIMEKKMTMEKKMSIWLICDDYYHPGHVPEGGLQPFAAAGHELTVTMDVTDFPADDFGRYDVVVFSKSNNKSFRGDETDPTTREPWLTPAIQQKLVDFVENGGGLLATHSGVASYAKETIITDLIGCVFTGHPEACPVTMTMLKPHPITANVENHTETDEHYFINVLAADADIFMATASANGAQVGGYTRTRGKGRVCVLTPGHNLPVWLNPQYQVLLGNALNWCTQR